jgi:hypothetical protein
MYKRVQFCDICEGDGCYRLATHEYWTDARAHYVVCPDCAETVESAGLSTQPLDLDETFLDDILDGAKGLARYLGRNL